MYGSKNFGVKLGEVVMENLGEKYGRYSRTGCRVVAEAGGKKGRLVVCSLCGVERRARGERGAEYICHLCLAGMADAYNPVEALSQEELVKAIRDRRLKQLRVKYGLTQGDLSRIIGISMRQIMRYENSQYISLDSVIKKVQENDLMSHP